MPVINFNYKDFCKLVGKRYSLKELEETLPMMGLEWEGVDGDEVSVELFPNRPDLLSVEGLARAYRQFRDLKSGLVTYSADKSDYELVVDDSVKEVRPFIAAVVVKDVKLSDEGVKSLMQLQEKLHTTHCRRRAKAAIGVHDLRVVNFPVRYAAVEPDSVRFIPLESTKEMTPEQVLSEHAKGIKYSHLVDKFAVYPMVLSHDNKVLSFPPIINSELTKVRPNTKDLFIEITGTDEFTINKAMNIVVTSLLERGAKAYQVKVHYGRDVKVFPDFSNETVKLGAGYTRKLLGEKIQTRSLPPLLRNMGFGVDRDDEELKVTVPCYRTDVMHPIDLVEEVAIAYGYEKFEPLAPEPVGVGRTSPLYSRIEYVKDLLVGFGLIEVYNWLLTSEDVLFTKLGMEERDVVEILHPKTEDLTVCRDSLVPQLIEFLAKNKHNDYPQKIFEAGEVLLFDKGVVQETHLGLAFAHSRSNYSELKAVLDVLFNELSVSVSIRNGSKPYCIPGRVAELFLNDESVGFIGEVHPGVLENYDLKVPVTVCELDIKKLVG